MIASVEGPENGGIGIFLGTVRASAADGDRPVDDVVALEYEAHEALATEKLRSICEDAGERWDVRRAAAIHRIGHCALGEVTVVVACGAPHREDALEACRWIIDSVKKEVPIFKREIYTDGAAWVEPERTPNERGAAEPSV